MSDTHLSQLRNVLETRDNLDFSLLFGSRARGDATAHSDWDFAVSISGDMGAMERLAIIEDIRSDLAKALDTSDELIQIVDLRRAGLSISNTVIEEGIVLTEANSLALANFFTQVWALVQDFQWRQKHEPRDLSATST